MTNSLNQQQSLNHSNFLNNNFFLNNSNVFINNNLCNLKVQNNRDLFPKNNNEKKIEFMTLNIRGINDLNKARFLKDYLIVHKVEICFLQETHIDSHKHVEELESILDSFFCFFTININKTKGVGILISKYLENFEVTKKIYDIDSRFINIEMNLENKKINLVNIYAPNLENEQMIFISKMYERCSGLKNIIIAGDFNAVNKTNDRIGSSVKKLKKHELEWNKFKSMFYLNECIYEREMSDQERMTWSNNGVSSKIDKIFYSKDLNIIGKYTNIKNTLQSDHKAVFSYFKIDKIKSHKVAKKFKPWRLNENILKENEVILGVKNICAEIPYLKKIHKKLWYDFFIEQIIFFLKKKGRKFNEKLNIEKNNLFKKLEIFNKTQFRNDEEFLLNKNILNEDLSVFYNNQRLSIEKRNRDDRFKFCKQPTKIIYHMRCIYHI